MKLQLTTKNCEVVDKSRNRLDGHIAKIVKLLPDLESDLVLLRLTIRRNIDRYFPPRIPHKNKTYSDSKTTLAYFEGTLAMPLFKNSIYVHFKGATIDECIKSGFEKLFVKIRKFKDLHFSSRSTYPNRSSIREVLYE